jgi:HAD superfamily hydrolase (TIGR01549 family)
MTVKLTLKMPRYSPSQKSSAKKVIIFDFDGVLVDSFRPFYRLNRDAMAAVGISLTEHQYRDLYTGNVHRGFDSFIGDADKLTKFVDFKTKGGDAYRSAIDFFPGAIDFIRALDTNLRLGIVSAGKQEFIESILIREKIRDCFYYISGSQNHTKADAIREALAKARSQPKVAYMITDTSGDILAAKEVGLATIAVTWGFHSVNQLNLAGPDFVANNFSKLKKILSS